MTKLRTRRLRFIPIARSIPSSDFRSSASITKMFTSNRTPAMIEKLPMNRKNDPRLSPDALAASSNRCLAFSTEVPCAASGPSAALILLSTALLRAFPPSTPPVLETKVKVCGWTLLRVALAA